MKASPANRFYRTPRTNRLMIDAPRTPSRVVAASASVAPRNTLHGNAVEEVRNDGSLARRVVGARAVGVISLPCDRDAGFRLNRRGSSKRLIHDLPQVQVSKIRVRTHH